MSHIRILLLFVITLVPSLSFAIAPVFSAIQSTHTFSCNVSLASSIGERVKAVDAIWSSDLTPLKRHHQKLKEMNDVEFKQYLSGELWKVALCHPMASSLLGMLPGKDHLEFLNTLTHVPASADRKFTYAVWAYSSFYRTLNKHISQMQARINVFSSNALKVELATAQRLAEKLRNIAPQDIVEGAGGEALDNWFLEELERQKGSIEKTDLTADSEAPKSNLIGESVIADGADAGDSYSASGFLRPTIPVYALVGYELLMYEVDSVDLLFPLGAIEGNSCYERFAPEFPIFARLINQGKATKIAAVNLKVGEREELLKFFNSAAGIEAQGFLLADQSAVALTGRDTKLLTSCLKLIPKNITLANWESGAVINFEFDNKLWQTLIAMLAAKRIQIAQ